MEYAFRRSPSLSWTVPPVKKIIREELHQELNDLNVMIIIIPILYIKENVNSYSFCCDIHDYSIRNNDLYEKIKRSLG